MFDVGYGEMLVIAIVALLVVGPEKLPSALRTAGLWIAKLRRGFDKVRAEIEQEVGADEIRRQLRDEAMLDQGREIRREIEATARSVQGGSDSLVAATLSGMAGNAVIDDPIPFTAPEAPPPTSASSASSGIA